MANNNKSYQDQLGQRTQIKETKSTEKVKLMKRVMRKYRTTDTVEILKQIYQSGDQGELNQWRTLNLTPMAQQIKQQATVEIRT